PGGARRRVRPLQKAFVAGNIIEGGGEPMDMEIKQKFERLWKKYFNGSELPLVFFYCNDRPPRTDVPKPTADHRCLIGDLAKARRGRGVALNAQVIGCSGGIRYLGYSDT